MHNCYWEQDYHSVSKATLWWLTGEMKDGDVKLCERCSNIDCAEIISMSKEKETSNFSLGIGTVVSDLGPISKWNRKTCELCAVLFASIPRAGREQPTDDYSLRFQYAEDRRLGIYYPILKALSPETTILKLDRSDPKAYLTHSPFLVLQRAEDQTGIQILKKDSIDYSHLRNWLHICREMHTNTCSAATEVAVSSLKLIDCRTRTVIRADPTSPKPYVTLSYVCGTINDPPHAPDKLPVPAPKTIEDAILVTLNLNLQYLWVDRYCIDQQNLLNKLAQIQQMNLIYSTSEVTLIAAAGKDAYYGLPGVSSCLRIEHPRAIFNGYQIASTLQPIGPVYGDLDNSHWSTRAWCYQEALLSKRRLIFTDEQIYYECHGMSCCEVLDLPYREMHQADGQSFREEYRYFSTREVGKFTAGVGRRPHLLFKRIEEYTMKNISFQSDRLNAFLGILSRFEMELKSSRHLWGQPMIPEQDFEGYLANASEYALSRARVWFGLASFVDGLTWDMNGVGGREKDRPSWSWTGWPHAVRYNFIFSSVEKGGGFPDVTIGFEIENGIILDWDSLQSWYSVTANASQLCRVLHITAFTLDIRLIEYEDAGRFFELDLKDGGYIEWAVFSASDKDSLHTSSWLLRDDLPSTTNFQALMIARNSFDGAPDLVFLMIVTDVDGATERVGGGWLSTEAMLCNANGDEIHFEEHGEWISGLKAKHGIGWWRSLVGEMRSHKIL